MILVVDNYDSFTYNLVDIIAKQNDVIVKYPDDEDVYNLDVTAVIISPGPGHPLDNNHLLNIIEHCKDKPILGVCLGAQALTCYYGGKVIQGDEIKHGKVDSMKIIKDTNLYTGVSEYSNIMRYHSLVSDPQSLPSELIITGETPDCIQSFEHRTNKHYGIQYHPESFASEFGEHIINNFLTIAGEVNQDGTINKTTTARPAKSN
ncbi:anthranilate synthase component II [Staphylococcus kloosii]|uniref:Glutamine amidotransferase n=1 Tax=Staphylococcus kloosii TaxID=29384 RepID=A0ABQ0XNU8_9STAP|nr:aminodeoxychorismate/anthranilate synthase component II [Staphylococcus kloosii]AVQ36263.1 aminodeoxychorismate/anthranilate synthase component II [Staphylococcus kloosii]PNZ03384.1 glutamine amidotransferase [Staphylococcus kloosii]GEP83106.1 glutamine amidotransferase [Staphylococcus kloosii]SUM49344.1 anthranilate synthase component II [Staphylococcus kloosii]